MKEELGIDKVIDALSTIVDVSMSIDKAYEDSKIDIFEGLSLGRKSLGFFAIVKNAPEIWAQIKDIDADEKQQVVNYFIQNFDLRDDKVEMIVEEGFVTIVSVAETFLRLKEAKK